MDEDPVYVTFEFDGNLSEEVNKVTLRIKGLRDESAETFKRLLQESHETFSSMSEQSRQLAVVIQQDIVSLRLMTDAQNALDAEFREGAVTIEAYVQAKARLTLQEGELRTKITEQTRELALQNSELKGIASAASAPVSGFNTLNFSIQQVARELPSLTMGAQMFFLAISNNLPMLADQIKKARTEYTALIAQGQKATPVWKQILGSVVSWQTALVMGITLLTLYGKEIGAWVSGLFKGGRALDDVAGRQKAFNREVGEAYKGLGDSVVAIEKLSAAWKELGGDMGKQEKFIIDNKSEFDKLNISIRNVSDAENLLVDNTPAFIEAMKLKAQAAAASKLAAEQYEEEMRLRKKAGDTRDTAKLPLLQRQSKFLNPSYDDELEKRRRRDYADGLALNIDKEADAARNAAEAYFTLSEAKAKEATAALSSAGLHEKEDKSALDVNRIKADTAERLREIEEARNKIRRGELEAELDLQEEQIRLMGEGVEKTLAEIDLAYDRRIAQIAKKGEELIREQRDVERKIWEAEHPKWREEGLTPPVATTRVEQLPEATQRNLDDRVFLAREQRLKDTTAAEREAAGKIEKIQEEVAGRLLSGLDRQLAATERFYDEKIKLARESGASEEVISNLLAAKEKETTEKRKESYAAQVKEYGNYEQKKKEITERYEKEIARLPAEMQQGAMAKRDRELSELDADFIESSNLWKKLFSDTSALTLRETKHIADALREMILAIADEEVKQKLLSMIDEVSRKAEENSGAIERMFGNSKGAGVANLFFGEGDFKSKIEAFSSTFKGAEASSSAVASNSGKAASSMGKAGGGAANTLAIIDAIIKGIHGAIQGTREVVQYFREYEESVNGHVSQKTKDISESLEILAEFDEKVYSGWEKLKSGNVIGAITDNIIATHRLFTAGSLRAKEWAEEINRMIQDEISGEIKLNEYYRQRYEWAQKIGESNLDHIRREGEELHRQSEENASDYQKKWEQLQGQEYLKDKYTEKRYGLFFGFKSDFMAVDRHVEVWEKLNELTYDEISLLYEQNKLTEESASLFEDLKKLKEEGLDIDKMMLEYEERKREAQTGNAFSSITESIISGFNEGRRSAQEFADDFEDMMKAAVLQAVKLETLQTPLREWYESFAAAAEDGLTEEEIRSLRQMYNKIIEAAGSQLADLEEATGLDFSLKEVAKASQKGIETMSQDSVDALNGKFVTMLYYQDKIHVAVVEMRTLVASAISMIGDIAVNTSYCRRLEAIDRNMEKIARISEAAARDGVYMKTR